MPRLRRVGSWPLLDGRHVEITAGFLPLVAKGTRMDDHNPTIRTGDGGTGVQRVK
jgi:hypothetical protein